MNSLERKNWLRENLAVHIYKGKGFYGHVNVHSHEFYHCLMVLTGAITQQQYGQTYHQLPGALFSTPPNTPHSLFIFDANTTYYCVSYPCSLIDIIFSPFENEKNFYNSPSPCITPDIKTQKVLVSMLDLLMEKQDQKAEESPFVRASIAEAFIKIVAGSIQGDPFKEREEEQRPGVAEIKKCIHFIDENYATINSVEDLTLFSGLSKSMLCRLFLKETNMTVHQYITEKRIYEAARIINLKNASLTETASMVGYGEFSTFYRNFIKVTKMSPSKYQQLVKEKYD